jgi:hypothetical protein
MMAENNFIPRIVLTSIVIVLLIIVVILSSSYNQSPSQVSSLQDDLSSSEAQVSSQAGQISSLQSSVSSLVIVSDQSAFNPTEVKVIVNNLNVTVPRGNMSEISRIATFISNHSGYVQISGPASGSAYFYVEMTNALHTQNQTYSYLLGPLIVPVPSGIVVISLGYRVYGDVGVVETADLTVVYYY